MDDKAIRDLSGHLFALITARLEDAATLAVQGQVADQEQVRILVTKIIRKIDDVQSYLHTISRFSSD